MGNNQYPPPTLPNKGGCHAFRHVRQFKQHVSCIRDGSTPSCHCEEGVSPTSQSHNRGDNAIFRFAQNDLAPVSVIADLIRNRKIVAI